jgi:hypothetical protein
MRKPQLLTILALATICALPVRADITYQYITDQSTYNAATAGQSVTVQLLLQETLTGGSTSLLASENGLFGAGVYVTRSGSVPASPTTIAGPIAFNLSAVPAGFATGGNNSAVPATTTNAGVLESVSNATAGGPTGPTGTQVNASTRDVLLGTMTLTAGAAGTTTQFTIESYKNFSTFDGNTLTFTNGYDLDLAGGDPSAPVHFNGADGFTNTFTVNVPGGTASPEPGTLLLTASGAFLLAGGAWRRRRAKSNVPVQDGSSSDATA